ncbi:helix-turn-helix domain-containing protein [Streptosporangium subroseum]|uniref:helix-turn-helix domain-containing protein n=1 Tax=Streptosporangium subroseum TaxID=106412 RepID=UPI0030919977|nr:helix-turn-helix domain-containing protein [Streptosporangium subroseum]
MAESRLDTVALHAALDAQRERRGLSWRQLAKEVGVSPSTMTRLAQGQRPDVDAFAALVHWLGQPADTFLRGQQDGAAEDADLVAQMASVIRARRDLRDEDAKYLENLLKAGTQGIANNMNRTYAGLYESFVEWVYDNANSPLGDVEFDEFSQRNNLDSNASFGLLRYCKERGLLDDKYSTLGGPSANMTGFGRQWVEERRQRRADPVQRTMAVRQALLIWLWKAKQQGVHLPIVDKFIESDDALFEGAGFELGEVDRAAEHLEKKGLIKGINVAERSGPVRAETTETGDDCVEQHGGNVAEYDNRRSGETTIHIHGDNTGNVAANSRDVTMNARTVKGIEMGDVITLARALRQAAPMLGLPDRDAEELVETADRIENEAASEDPDLSRIRRWSASALALVNSPVVSGALGGVLSAYGAGVLPGLPPG